MSVSLQIEKHVLITIKYRLSSQNQSTLWSQPGPLSHNFINKRSLHIKTKAPGRSRVTSKKKGGERRFLAEHRAKWRGEKRL
jgi:hypothetical protein